MRSSPRKGPLAVLIAVGMVAAVLSVATLSSPAGAAPQTVVYDCGIPLAAGTTAPITVQYDGTAPTAVRPDAADVTVSGITATVILDPTFVSGLLQGFIDAGFPAPSTIDFTATVGIASSGPVTPADTAPQGPLASQSGPQAPNPAGNSFTFLLADETFANAGAVDGDVAGFLPGAASTAAFILEADTVPLAIGINGCVLADGVTPTTSGSPPSGAVSPPPAPFAETLFENAAPVANGQSVQVIKDNPKAITLTASDDVAVASYAIDTPPANGTVVLDDPVAGTATYTPDPGFEGSDSFTFTATDDEGKTGAAATVTLTVVGGDSKDQILNQEIIGDRLYLDQLEDGILTMSPVTLDGATQYRDISMDDLRVRDARGNPASGWALDAKVLNGGLAHTDGATAALPGGVIPDDKVSLDSISCTVTDGAPVAAVESVGAGGSFGSGASVFLCDALGPTSGGSFLADGTVRLEVPPYVYTGIYSGTIQFTVQ